MSASRLNLPDRYRFQLLDAMRGVAAILVVLYHQPLELQSRFHSQNSFLAVDFFFCLSGFVVAYAYAERLRGSLTLRDFAVIRLIRLYPLFALSIVIGILRSFISPLRLSALHSTAELDLLFGEEFLLIPNVMVGGLGGELFPLNGPAWSLFLELIANLGYAYTVRLRIVARVLPAFYVLALIAIFAAVLWYPSLDFGAEIHGLGYGFGRVGVSFLSGVALYRLFRRTSNHSFRGISSLVVSTFTVGLLLGTLLLDRPFAHTGVFQITVIVFVFPTTVYLGAHCSLPKLFSPICAFLGDLSYPLYILHVPLMLPYSSLFAWRVLRNHMAWQPYLVFVDLGLLIPVCWWIGRHLDQPFRARLSKAVRNAPNASALARASVR